MTWAEFNTAYRAIVLMNVLSNPKNIHHGMALLAIEKRKRRLRQIAL
jgi:hypothetical protein